MPTVCAAPGTHLPLAPVRHPPAPLVPGDFLARQFRPPCASLQRNRAADLYAQLPPPAPAYLSSTAQRAHSAGCWCPAHHARGLRLGVLSARSSDRILHPPATVP